MFIRPSLRRPYCPLAKNDGFTLFETLIAAAIVGILAAIAGPTFFGFLEKREVEAVQHRVYQAMRSTQMDAMKYRQEQQFSLRQQEEHLEWSSHPRSVSPTRVKHWEALPKGVVLADRDNTLPQASGIRYVRFNFQGDVKYRLGTVTLTGANGGNVERCVIVSTLIGAMRKGEGHHTPNSNDRYCY